MNTTVFTPINWPSLILAAIFIMLLLLTALRAVPPLFASVGWHGPSTH